MVQLLLSNQYRQSHPEEGHRREEDSPFSKSPAFMSQNQRPQDSLLHSLGRSHSRFPSSVNAGQMLTAISPSMPGVQMTLLLSSLWYLNRTFISASQGAACLAGYGNDIMVAGSAEQKVAMYFGCMICMIPIKVDDKLYKDWNLLDWWSFDNMSKFLSNFLF